MFLIFEFLVFIAFHKNLNVESYGNIDRDKAVQKYGGFNLPIF